jgi:DNA repair protein RadC
VSLGHGTLVPRAKILRIVQGHIAGVAVAVPIADLPPDQRPRERLCTLGADALSDAELIALVLRNGRRGESAVDVAAKLLAENGGAAGLARVRPEELARCPGIGMAKAAALVAAFRLARRVSDGLGEAPELRRPGDVAAAVRTHLADERRERLVVLVCDGRDRLRRRVIVTEGAIDRSPMPVREVLNAVLRHDGRAFAVAHNHPSGDPEPSLADRRATTALADAAKAVGLRFLGHVVVAGDSWASVTPCR